MQMQKSAQQAEFENAYWDAMAKQASVAEANATEELFNEAFWERTEKLAAADPEYAQALEQEQVKSAFNQGYYQALADAGVQFQ